MSSWYPSWLPRLSSFDFNLPSAIQRRFLSFILKQALGHLLKPGQFDLHQIDSQIGSGYVQVKDLELDHSAINSLLSGLPFQLHDGFITSAIVRVPLPNPLTSNVGLSIRSLHLTLHVALPSSLHAHGSNLNLAESVASVAETFVHDELSAQEEEDLIESLPPEVSVSQNLPGGLEPVTTGEQINETDPAGVSLFATLIESLMARFEFKAEDTKITVVYPGRGSFTLSIAELTYGNSKSEAPPSGTSLPDSTKPPARPQNLSRSIDISGINITYCNLHPSEDLSASAADDIEFRVDTKLPAHSAANTDFEDETNTSMSDLDEETQMMMSQSIIGLPRPDQPPSDSSGSSSGSLYESAISLHPEASRPSPPKDSLTTTPQHIRAPAVKDELVLSFGDQPLVISIQAPAILDHFINPSTSSNRAHSMGHAGEKLVANLEVGPVACAFCPQHVLLLCGMLELLGSSSSPPSKAKGTAQFDGLSVGVEVNANLRGFSLFLLADNASRYLRSGSRIFKTPFESPQLPVASMRLKIEEIICSFHRSRLHPSSGKLASSAGRRRSAKASVRSSLCINVGDVSCHAFPAIPSTAVTWGDLTEFPILIMDHALASRTAQGTTPQSSRPNTASIGDASTIPKSSTVNWGQYGNQTTTSGISSINSGEHKDAAVLVDFESLLEAYRKTRTTIRARIAPVHVFCDFDVLLNHEACNLIPLIEGFQYAFESRDMNSSLRPSDSESTATIDSPILGSQDLRNFSPHRLTHDNAAGNHGGLDLQFGSTVPSDHQDNVGRADAMQLNVTCPILRFDLRCGPPPDRSLRSGSLVATVYEFSLTNVSPTVPDHFPTLHGELPSARQYDNEGGVHLRCQRASLAYSLIGESKASTFCSLGSTVPSRDVTNTLGSHSTPPLPPLPLTIKFSQSPSSTNELELAPSKLHINIHIPATDIILTKRVLDGLQELADDVSQAAGRLASNFGQGTGSPAGSSQGSTRTTDMDNPFTAENGATRTTVTAACGEVLVRFLVPRQENAVQPLDVKMSDVAVGVELGLDGRDDSRISLAIADAKVEDHSLPQGASHLITRTTPRFMDAQQRAMINIGFQSTVLSETREKGSTISLDLWGFTLVVPPGLEWMSDIALFAKAPPGVFESVVPAERTTLLMNINDGCFKILAPSHPGACMYFTEDLTISMEMFGSAKKIAMSASLASSSLFLTDDLADVTEAQEDQQSMSHLTRLRRAGYALVGELNQLQIVYHANAGQRPSSKVDIERCGLRIHICADTAAAFGSFAANVTSAFTPTGPSVSTKEPCRTQQVKQDLKVSFDEEAFRTVPEIGTAPDMIRDDLPTNLDYLDASFGAAAGLRELTDDDLDDFTDTQTSPPVNQAPGIVSNVGGETIRVLQPFQFVDDYHQSLPPDLSDGAPGDSKDIIMDVQLSRCDVCLLLYDGYDWARTRKVIEREVREMRHRLAKIRQLVASGQTDHGVDGASTLVFNSIHIGLEQDLDVLEPGAIISAIDEELNEADNESQSSWQTLQQPVHSPSSSAKSVYGRRLVRSRGPVIEIRLLNANTRVQQYVPNRENVSRTLIVVENLEILDHVKTSTWRKFLTSLRADTRGNVRETDSDMARIELLTVKPTPSEPSVEARLRAKILPLRLYVDQDALDFLKKFFSFKDPDAVVEPTKSDNEIYFQSAEIFPVDIKLDYKPRRVDYRALREGRTIELMNFFHFDGAEMTLRHLTLKGITGWPRLFDLLNDLWTPDVKATQLVDVISGVSPIRSVVNVGSGVADLILLPIAQYKKDGRVVRGLQKGTKAFVQSTAMEAIKLGAHLATGTQVILEQAENVLGGQWQDQVTAETVAPLDEEQLAEASAGGVGNTISKYAEQPVGMTEGMQLAYRSLQQNFRSAAQTILAVPMEVYENSGQEGAMKAVVRAVPIAVLKPMIGASEAVSKTLMGLHNTLDPSVQLENDAKYKHR